MIAAQPVLSVSDIDISFTNPVGDHIGIASGMSFVLERGKSMCLVGRSGSGKTSILRVVAGLSHPQGGTVQWWGQDLASMQEEEVRAIRRTRIGYVDQASTLIPDLSALENVLLPALPDGRRAVAALRGRAQDLLHAFGLESRMGNRPNALSGGERQRVAIARAMLHAPELLIVDEPTASLDRSWADEVIRLLREYQQDGCALLTASHDAAVLSASDDTIEVEPDRLLVTQRRGLHES